MSAVKRILFLFVGLSVASAAFAADTCDRQCPRGFVTAYLNALVAHNPATPYTRWHQISRTDR
jgi:hypothetical protein